MSALLACSLFSSTDKASHGRTCLRHIDIKIRAGMSKWPHFVAILTCRRVFWCHCDVKGMISRDSLVTLAQKPFFAQSFCYSPAHAWLPLHLIHLAIPLKYAKNDQIECDNRETERSRQQRAAEGTLDKEQYPHSLQATRRAKVYNAHHPTSFKF